MHGRCMAGMGASCMAGAHRGNTGLDGHAVCRALGIPWDDDCCCARALARSAAGACVKIQNYSSTRCVTVRPCVRPNPPARPPWSRQHTPVPVRTRPVYIWGLCYRPLRALHSSSFRAAGFVLADQVLKSTHTDQTEFTPKDAPNDAKPGCVFVEVPRGSGTLRISTIKKP